MHNKGSLRARRAGKSLADGFRGIFAMDTGDWSMYAHRFKLKQSWSTQECCHQCHVELSGTNSFTRLDPEHSSFTTRRTDTDWKSDQQIAKQLPGRHVNNLMRDFVHNAPLGTMSNSTLASLHHDALLFVSLSLLSFSFRVPLLLPWLISDLMVTIRW